MPRHGRPDSPQLLPEKLSRLLADGVEKGIFPGVAVGIVSGPPSARSYWHGFYGQRQRVPEVLPLSADTSYDLASLSKPLATTLAVLALYEEGRLSLDDTLPHLLGQDIPADKKNINLRQLLSHSSGLAAHRPYYLELKDTEAATRAAAMRRMILAEPLAASPGATAIYSDLGFMLLGWIVAERSGMGLDRFVRERIYRPLALADNLFFRPLDKPWPAGKTAAAGEECPWRGKVLVGEVGDDNTHVLGGVAGQAGLFGDLAAVVSLVVHLLDCWQERDTHPAFANRHLKTFLRKDERVPDSCWALGFDTPSPQGSSAGRHFHPASVGHLGFSGTSFWIDPSRDLVVVLLSNRVHPSRENGKIKAFRPLFHDLVSDTLGV